MTRPDTLILCSHGTRVPAGQRAVLRLAAAVAERLPHVVVRAAYLDVQDPHVRDVVASLGPAAGTGDASETGGTLLVPTLLSTGYHVKTDLTRAAAARPGVRVAAPLGPDPRLTDLLVRRLREATGELLPDDAVILAAAGSSDPEAGQFLAAAAADLGTRLGRPVAAANAAGGRPRLPEVIAGARTHGAGRVILASYLLAPGFFADKLAAAGADVVTAPLLGPERTPEELLDLVVARAGLPRPHTPVASRRRTRSEGAAATPPAAVWVGTPGADVQIIRSPSDFSNLPLLSR